MRELLREGVEPNPGPALDVLIASLRVALGVWATQDDVVRTITSFQQTIQDHYGAHSLVTGAEVKEYIHKHNNIFKVHFKDDAGKVKTVLFEVIGEGLYIPVQFSQNSLHPHLYMIT